MANELPIPGEAKASPSVEMVRVWLANEKIHVVLNIGFWEERGLDERAAWGILLADMVHHVANAHESEFGHDRRKSVAMIRRAFEAEMDNPTSERLGEFVNEKRGQDT
jgi:hypothetical protein